MADTQKRVRRTVEERAAELDKKIQAHKEAIKLLEEKKAVVEVLKSTDRWYGVTYHEDKEAVVRAIAGMKEQGLYPQRLWN